MLNTMNAPSDMSAPMPPVPQGPPMGPPAQPGPVDLVIAALGQWGQQRSAEQNAVLAAVMQATGAAAPGIQGVTEGSPFETSQDASQGVAPAGPVDPSAGGAYPLG